ncbi:MAG TPA: DUF58 domain-containing protein [Stellaceae bacterium]|nr:DUF58 domain-containing protein [Stellaceae bacterium]
MAVTPAPGTLKHRAEELAAQLPPLLVEAERVAVTVSQGVHGRRRVGQGETFWQFRQYEPGEPAQRIDWRESARSERLYVRETEWEASESVWIWRDTSPSMSYSSEASHPTKRYRADLIALALAALLIRGGERVTLLGSGLTPAAGNATLNRLALLIERAGGAPGPSLPGFEPLPRYGQLVMIGDLLSPLGEIEALARRFAALGVKGHLLQVLDPVEETLPFEGRVRFEGLENEDTLLMARVETIRGQYEERLQRHREGLAALAQMLGWSFGMHRTDRPATTALLTLYGALARPKGP